MKLLIRIALLIAGVATLSWSPALSAHSASMPLGRPLSGHERMQVRTLSHLSAHSPEAGLRWIARQSDVDTAILERDGATLSITFRDGARFLLLPPQHAGIRERSGSLVLPRSQPLGVARDSAPGGRAAVLEPFATQLGEGTSAGQTEVDALTRAGFKVDVFRDSQVTVKLMETISQYSVVYMVTHSTPVGTTAFATDETDYSKYIPLIQDGSVIQLGIAGDPTGALYLGVNSTFITKHVGTFPNGSMVFLEGCGALHPGDVFSALQSKNVDVFVAWTDEVYPAPLEVASDFMFSKFLQGETVGTVLSETKSAGLADSSVQTNDRGLVQTHLGYLGDASDTFGDALSAVLPAAVSTATPTATATATSTPVPTATATKVTTGQSKAAKLKAAKLKAAKLKAAKLKVEKKQYKLWQKKHPHFKKSFTWWLHHHGPCHAGQHRVRGNCRAN